MKNSLPQNINILDLQNLKWSIGPTLSVPRDDFAWAFDEKLGKLYVFGGFVSQAKVNDLTCFNLQTQKISVINGGPSRRNSTTSNLYSDSTR
jgi:hypothetical protein